jgi:3-phosphoshikimate 1-carboxyvinyltransferase
MPDTIEVTPSGPFSATVRPPGSKSITNRALICAALAKGRSQLDGALDSEDTQVMLAALARLGLAVHHDAPAATMIVEGAGGVLPVGSAKLFVENSGTTMRFLTAMLAACHGHFRLDGSARMRERPIGDLLDALQSLGAHVQSEDDNYCPPVVMDASGLDGGAATIRGDVSSQFLSGLLMAAPCARQDVLLRIDGQLVSQPYVRMTISVMREFGVEVDKQEDGSFRVPGNQKYDAVNYSIEPDASAASYFWAAAAIAGGTVTVEGLPPDALQGDVRFCHCLTQMGCAVIEDQHGISVTGGPLRGIDVDMQDISDTVQTLAAVALFASGPTRIRGVAHIRQKETDRIGDLARELRRLGARVEEFADGLEIEGGQLQGTEIETYNDHRMAMSLALVGLRIPDVVIRDPNCTRKTYPNFFADLASLKSDAQD